VRTRLCDLLAIEHPILNAPMGMVAGAPLAAAVSDGADWPDGVAIRALRNTFTDEWHGREDEVPARSEQRSDENRPGDYRFSRERGVTPAGESVGVVGTVEPAGDLVRRLAAEAETLLRRRPADLLG
jgi:nitronate monooxygenase